MANWERTSRGEKYPRRKTPSFSSSLLESIYHSIDESRGEEDQLKEENNIAGLYKRNNAVDADEEIASLRRAIMVEKWMESYTRSKQGTRHFTSDSGSSTDSSIFSSSETDSASRSTPKSSSFAVPKPKQPQNLVSAFDTTPKHEGRFMRTKSRALKIYGDLKKTKQPISPGRKIANFLNSIFNSKNLKKAHQDMEEWSSAPVRKSRSMRDSNSMTCSLASRSCLSKPPSSRNKSKRCVRFCPVSVIVDEDSQPCGQKNICDKDPCLTPMPNNPRNHQFNNKTAHGFRGYDKNFIKYDHRGSYDDHYEDDDDDERSCTSSDLFELENLGMIGNGVNLDELPVYGTTNLKINQAIANGLIM